MNKEIVYIHTNKTSPRLRYVLDWIFNVRMGLSYEIVYDLDALTPDAMVIVYGDACNNNDHLVMYKHHILTEDCIYAQDIAVHKNEGDLPYFFATFDVKGDYHFDLFALVFYLISRYEEYLRFVPDNFDRFSSHQSLAARHDFLELPLADLWIDDLKQKIIEKWGVEIKTSTFSIHPTFDIDTPYAFLAKPLYLHVAATMRDIFLFRGKRLNERIKTLFMGKRDAFDTYDQIIGLLEKHNLKAIFFFLMKFKLPDDQNFSVKTQRFREVVKHLSELCDIGMHPSLSTNKELIKIAREKVALEKLSSQKIYRSRQHFLQLKMPLTYQNLVQIGITHDYSMGYHDRIGFRASTCFPFMWYDLEREESTDLFVHPHHVMDATLKYHQKFSVEEAVKSVEKIKEATKEVNGQFRFIWHNSSFAHLYGWADWDRVLEECLSESR